jgi:TonB family protein
MSYSQEAIIQKRRGQRAKVFVVLSLALHGIVLLLVFFFPGKPSPMVPPQAVFVDLNALPPQNLVQFDDEKKDQGQIVESEQADNSQIPEKADKLGEKNQVVSKETKARAVGSFQKGSPIPQRGGQGRQQLKLSDLRPSKQNEFTPPTKAEIEGWQKLARNEPLPSEPVAGTEGAGAEAAASSDYLKDIAEGDRTLLTTKEFVYFGYYRRIRERLEVAWNRNLRATVENVFRGGRQLSSNQDYVTGVIVALDGQGQVIGVQVLRNSGSRDLDQAAVDAFNKAGPFPNPPAGLVDEKGQIKIRWDFALLSSR